MSTIDQLSDCPLGTTVTDEGVAFKVWAPHADAVSVVGDFNDWQDDQHPLERDGQGNWSGFVSAAKLGQQYRFAMEHDGRKFTRVDPRAREVTNSIGNGIITRDDFDWSGDTFTLPPMNELVIYELHIGSFHDPKEPRPATFEEAIHRLDHLMKLGVNCIEIMPLAEFAGDFSWGYNPAHLFAVESSYGGRNGLKKFVKEAHLRGIGVLLDVVYNHFGPSDLNLWQFDGWSENGKGGIYFYNDDRSSTPWGDTRPDFGRPEVRQFITDNALMWIDVFHMDGLRYDMTLYMRTIDGDGDIPDGWSLTREVNELIHDRCPRKLTIAEDLQNNPWITKDGGAGGAAFRSQWDAQFVHPIREAVITPLDEHRSLNAVCAAIEASYNGDRFQRVIYSESHDEVANGKARVPAEISDDPSNWYGQKRSVLAAGLVMTSPGIPMLFQGQEFLQGGWFRDDVPLDWDQSNDYRGIVKLYRDLIALRLNREGVSAGLTGSQLEFLMVDHEARLLAFRRSLNGGPGDDCVVVCNFSQNVRECKLRFPSAGRWRLRFNGDFVGYSPAFQNTSVAPHIPAEAVDTEPVPNHDQLSDGTVHIGPYALLILSQDPPAGDVTGPAT